MKTVYLVTYKDYDGTELHYCTDDPEEALLKRNELRAKCKPYEDRPCKVEDHETIEEWDERFQWHFKEPERFVITLCNRGRFERFG